MYNQKKDNNQLKKKTDLNYQKIKLHGTPITKELKKHSSRPVGGVNMGKVEERTGGRQQTEWPRQRDG